MTVNVLIWLIYNLQLITFRRPISLNKPENSVQTTSTIEFEEPIEEQEISFTTNSDNIFPDINIDGKLL